MEVTISDHLGGFRGEVTVTVRNAKTGRFVRRIVVTNTVTDELRSAVAAWLSGANINVAADRPPPDRTALGTGTPSAAGLGVETAGTRKVCAYRQVYASYYAQYTTQYMATDPAATFTEAALFDSAGHVFAFVSLGLVPKSTSETLTLQWKILVKGNAA